MWLDYYKDGGDPSILFEHCLTLDLETTIRNKVGKQGASSFCVDNECVCIGIKHLGNVPRVFHPSEYEFGETDFENILLVGQNIKFDLLWLMRLYPKIRENIHKVTVWDTQLAEYLLTGQDSKWANLNQLAEKYGGTLKDDRIAEFWKAGVDTTDIPKEMLYEYQEYDVINTEIVFLAQLDIILEQDQFPLLMTQMDALVATTEMEFNGLKFDKALANSLCAPLKEQRDECYKVVNTLANLHGFKEDINLGSPIQVSRLIFGGKVKTVVTENIVDDSGEVVRFKSGKRAGAIRTRKREIEYEISALYPPLPGAKPGKNGAYPVGDKEIKQLLEIHERFGEVGIHALEALLEYRKVDKDINTYYVGLSNEVHSDGCLHGSFNHCATGTGRLSSSAPNLQNLSN